MAKAIQHRLLIHGSFNQHDMGIFESKAAAKRYLSECGNDKPYTLVPVIESPAPTDWGKEYAKILELREKAIVYIAQMIDKHDSVELLNPICEAESFGTTWGKDAAVSVCLDTEGLFLHESGYPGKDQMLCYFGDSTVIRIAAEVQKAIAGGMGK